MNDVTVSALAEQMLIDIENCKAFYPKCPYEVGEGCDYHELCDKKCTGGWQSFWK